MQIMTDLDSLLGKSDQGLHTGSITRDGASVLPLVVDLSSRLADADAEASSQLAEACDGLARSASLAPILPASLPMPDGSKAQRLVVVRVDDLRISPKDDVVHKAMVENLLQLGYPVTDAVIPGPEDWTLGQDKAIAGWLMSTVENKGFDVAVHGWRHTPDELAGNTLPQDIDIVSKGARQIFEVTGRAPLSYVPPNNAVDDNALKAIAFTGIPVMSAELDDFKYCMAVDKRGILHASNTVSFEKSWEGDCPYFTNEEMKRLFGDKNDAVFMIHPQTADTPGKRKQLFDMLAGLAAEPGTRLVNFVDYRKTVMPPMPLVERIQSARRTVWVEDAIKPIVDDKEKKALARDADLAWRYFDWGAGQFDGMAPGTADQEGDKLVGYPFVTMWDIASQIFANMSAHRLGLIQQKRFEVATDRILSVLGRYSYDYKGAKLPPTEVAIGKQLEQRAGYDSADTGRLLIALKALDAYSNGSFKTVKLVKTWNLEKTMPGGEMHDVDDGRLNSVQQNSYAAYSRRGFQLWGYEVNPVFAAGDPEHDMRDAVTTMAELQERGRIATEPLVTEEIELGAPPHVRLAADILYAAQIERYRSTGTLTCASETAIETPPYFTYQGYQIEGTGGKFVVDAPSDSSLARSTKREDKLRILNSKGAYLWYAARPGHYSSKLIEAVRNNARIKNLGFAAGLHEASGEMVTLSEVNTNGIILESIEYILNGRSPVLVI